jgi:hypothetical protein
MRSRRPRVIGGLNYLVGWALAALRRPPRAEPELRQVVRHDQLDRIRRRARGLGWRVVFRTEERDHLEE